MPSEKNAVLTGRASAVRHNAVLKANGDVGIDNVGTNKILTAAGNLFALAARLRSGHVPQDYVYFRQQLTADIQEFTSKLTGCNYPSQIVLAARHLLTIFLDEVISQTAFGVTNNWSEHPLVDVFSQQERTTTVAASSVNSGKQFFAVLKHLGDDFSTNRDALELGYVCLNLGFVGKFREQAKGLDALAKIKNELHALLTKPQKSFISLQKAQSDINTDLIAVPSQLTSDESDRYNELLAEFHAKRTQKFLLIGTITLLAFLSLTLFMRFDVKLNNTVQSLFGSPSHVSQQTQMNNGTSSSL